ncbi:MAG TPA: hypothetical protein VEJ87_05515 [Acidimicrobiales bacterium]|nr:hypothetical protein [Acidimicrobiales bacterium]
MGAAILSRSNPVLAVAFGGPSPEHDVSVLTGLPAVRELEKSGHDVLALYWSKTGEWHRVDNSVEAASFIEGVPPGSESLRLFVGEGGGYSSGGGRIGRPRPLPIDVIVNCCHGGPGEDGSLQAAFDLAGLAYTGPTVAGAAIGMDKLAFAGAVIAADVPALPRRLVEPSTTDVGFEGPYIVKPRFGGSSLGVELVEDLRTAVHRLDANSHLRHGAVIEPYREDLFDLNIAVRTAPILELSAIERPLRSEGLSEILGYADKYVGGEGMASAPRELPAKLDPQVEDELRALAHTVASVCQARGVARIDFLSDGESIYVNEINTVPGSLSRYLWVDPPVSFAELLDDMVREALERPAARRSTLGADGTVLRSAGPIAGKLA